MRYLHPVGVSEQFVASGTYYRVKDSVIQPGWSQQWAIHRQPDGSRKFRVDEDARESTGRSILTEVWVSPPSEGDQIARIDFLAYGGSNDPLKHIRAIYSFFEDHVEIVRSINNQPRQYEEKSLPVDYLPVTDAVLLSGLSTKGVIKLGGQGIVVSSRVDFTSETALAARIDEVVMTCEQEPQFEHDGRIWSVTRCDQTINHDSKRSMWVDEHQVPLKCNDLAGMTIVLRDYARAR